MVDVGEGNECTIAAIMYSTFVVSKVSMIAVKLHRMM